MHAAIPRDYGLLAAVMPSASSVYLGGLSGSIQLIDLPVQSTRLTIPWNKVTDLQLSGHTLIAVSAGTNQIAIIRNDAILHTIQEQDIVVSVSMVGDHLLVNTSYSSPSLHLWHVPSQSLVSRFKGHQQNKYLLRCHLGGFNQQFILCGGEDGRVLVWNGKSHEAVQTIQAHSSTVNQVQWNPKDHRMFASCSDDNTVKIFVTKDLHSSI